MVAATCELGGCMQSPSETPAGFQRRYAETGRLLPASARSRYTATWGSGLDHRQLYLLSSL